eukprot:3380439-Amphidinium_carterae.1
MNSLTIPLLRESDDQTRAATPADERSMARRRSISSATMLAPRAAYGSGMRRLAYYESPPPAEFNRQVGSPHPPFPLGNGVSHGILPCLTQ